MNDENNLPQPRTPEQIKWDAIEPYLLDPREDYPEPYYMLEYNGVPFSTIGGLGAISGQKKNGKSFVLTELMAAILGNGSERTNAYLPGLTVPQRTIDYLGHEPRVLYVDTEMEKLNSAKVLRRVHWLCNWDMKLPNERFNVLWVKNMPKGDIKPYKQRYELIRAAVDMIQPDVLFIDGLRDIIESINDEKNGTVILDELASLAEERKMCIWCALHQNPSRKNEDGDEAKMRGWIGTELGNKVSDTLVSIKSKTASGVTFTVKQQDARGKDLDDWKFEITDDAGNLGVPRIIGSGTNLTSKSKETEGDKPDDILQWINEADGQYEWPMSGGDIKKLIFGGIGGQKNHEIQNVDLRIAKNLGYLVESTLKKKGSYMLQPPEDLPF